MIRVKNALVKFCLIPIIILSVLFSACEVSENTEEFFASFSVTYIDVGEGDATLIKFPDDKVALIDTGANTDENYHKIVNELSGLGVNDIEWLILTHPDSEHIGLGERIIENLTVNNVYLPDVLNESLFPTIRVIKDSLALNGIEYKVSAWGEDMSDKDYIFKFLSPFPMIMSESLYLDLNFNNEPTGKQINNVSAIVYVEYKGLRFLFTGDAEEEAEKLLITTAKTGLLDVNFTEIDFLKIGNHGSKNSSCSEFLEYLKPKNSVISCGDSFNGHPATETLVRIMEANEKCKIYRTDVCGDIRVGINEQGEYKITNQIK